MFGRIKERKMNEQNRENSLKNKHNNRNKLHIVQNRGGYTLVEMIVVLLLMAILAGIAVYSMVSWVEWMEFRKQNETAQQIFIAAQNQLTEYNTGNMMSEVQTVLQDANGNYKKDTVVNASLLTNRDGESYSNNASVEKTIWKESDSKTHPESYQDVICSIRCKKGDYEKYSADKKSVSSDVALLFEMLSSYVTDSSILNGSICVEFTPDDGQVFAVLYSDRDKEFTYDSSSANADKVVDICNREEKYRKGKMLGYYGVDVLTKATSTKAEKPSIGIPSLNNEDTLNLSFKFTKIPLATSQMTYEIGIYDADTPQGVQKPVLKVILDGTKLTNKGMSNGVTGSNTNVVMCPVERYNYDTSGNYTLQNLGTFPFLAWLEQDTKTSSTIFAGGTAPTVRLVLDAADLNASSEVYQESLQTLKATDKKIADSLNAKIYNYTKTFSFSRFGVDVRNIYCTVQGSAAMYKTTAKKTSNTESAYFASDTLENSDAGNGSATTVKNINAISNARHFYNIRYREVMTGKQSGVVFPDVKKSTAGGAVDANGKTSEQQFSAVRYQLENDIHWTDFVNNQNLYCNEKSYGGVKGGTNQDSVSSVSDTTETQPFPSFKQLSKDHVLDGQNHAVEGLHISQCTNMNYRAYNYDAENNEKHDWGMGDVLKDTYPTGMFITNYGAIQNLTLSNAKVSGTNVVGAFCGVDNGTLVDLSTDAESAVKGTAYQTDGVTNVKMGGENIGGIAGQLASGGSISYLNLTNRATVEGVRYVGGIVGQLKMAKDASGDNTITLENCENYGIVQGRKADSTVTTTSTESEDSDNVRCLGGIVGYCDNETDDASKITLKDCISSPEYSEEEIKKIYDNSSNQSLRGVYVGGIVGFNYNATISNCSTESESKKQGYVVGNRYVGGIVGFNQSSNMANNADKSSHASDLVGGNADAKSQGVNEANVIGNSYVGGITGCNASFEENVSVSDLLDQEKEVRPGTTRTEQVVISNWVNMGVITAKVSYAGGITGYNTGNIINCNSKVENEDQFAYMTNNQANGDYCGGIAGYNEGLIQSETPISITSYVMGKNYVGGVVGYNDQNADVLGYSLRGGYIQASGCFAGGFVGMNASKNLLMQDGKAYPINVNPNEVSGTYFVGGSIGGNILPVKADETVKANMQTNNFLGSVKATAIAGGYIGYNRLVSVTDKTTADGTKTDDASIVKNIAENLKTAFGEKKDGTDAELAQIPALLKEQEKDSDSNGTTQNVTCAMEIGNNDSESTCKLGKVQGSIYLGGVLGYSAGDSKVIITKVMNETPVYAKKAIENQDEQKDADGNARVNYEDKAFKYSYAGGIVGKVSKNMTIISCQNKNKGDVISKGSYTGGLCEINEGTILECSVGSMGNSTMDYVGGICGLNKTGANIVATDAKGKTIIGKNYVGGIAAENFGNIYSKDDQSNGSGNVNGVIIHAVGDKGNVGGIAAYNAPSGSVKLADNVSNMTINSSGNNVGAVVGLNEGKVTADASNADSANQADETDSVNTADTAEKNVLVTVSGNIQGQQKVGGVIGYNKGASKDANAILVHGYKNDAAVTAVNGDAGGIIGYNEAGNIQSCSNEGVVTATKNGDAGGITSFNQGTIRDCNDFVEVSAKNGNCGGITALNGSKDNSNDEGTSNDESKKESLNNQNIAKIENCSVSGQEKNRLTFSALNVSGGVCAKNYGTISDTTVDYVDAVNLKTSDRSFIGGITGRNYGTISFSEGNMITNSTAKSYTNDSCVGGVTGFNEASGKIEGVEWYDADDAYKATAKPSSVIFCEVGFVSNNSGSAANFGGVAGKNAGTISNIAVQTNITGNLGSDDTGYGGIVGYNGGSEKKSAKITNCTFDGNMYVIGSSANIARIGGIAGQNLQYGEITGCRLGMLAKTNVKAGTDESTDSAKKASFVYMGGIVGANYGTVKSCDNEKVSTKEKNITLLKSQNQVGYEVLIKGYAGMFGGIVGYNYPGAVVTGTAERNLSTGENWTVNSNYTCNDAGIGGIIGYNASNKNMSYITNNANVDQSNGDNFCAGGLIGRNENKESSDGYVIDCVNYGSVSGRYSVGGLVGRAKFVSLHFKDCTNYGNISGTNEGVAGILGASYAINPFATYGNAMTFENCSNHGYIYAANSSTIAGIMGIYSESSEKVYMTNCVNTGYISGNNTSGLAGNTTGNFYIDRCRNYGVRVTNGLIKGSAASVKNSFDLSGSQKPISESDIPKNCQNDFFINSTSNQEGVQSEETSDFSYSCKATKGDQLANNLWNNSDVQANPARRSNWYGSKAGDTIIFTITPQNGKYVSMQDFVVTWCNGNGTGNTLRTYKATVTFTDMDGKSATVKNDTCCGYGSDISDWYKKSTTTFSVPKQDIAVPKQDIDSSKIASITLSVACKESNYVNIRALYWKKNGTDTMSPCSHQGDTEGGTITECSMAKKILIKAKKEDDKKTATEETSNNAENVITNDDGSSEGKTPEEYQAYCEGYDKSVGFTGEWKYDPSQKDYYSDQASSYWASKTRIPVYKDIDPKIIDFIQKASVKENKLSTPTNVKLDTSSGQYIYSWDAVPNAYSYEIKYRVVTTDGTVVQNWITENTNLNTFYTLNIPEEWYGDMIEFQVRAINAYEIVHPNDADKDKYSSDFSELRSDPVLKALPRPEYHFEQIAKDKVIAVLDNQDDYKLPDGSYIDCTIKFTGGNANVTCMAKDGFSETSFKTTSANNATYKATAAPANDAKKEYMGSQPSFTFASVIPATIFDGDAEATGSKITTQFNGFYGNNAKNLQYKTHYVVTALDNYMKADVMAYDNEVGAEISYAQGSVHVTKVGQGDAILTNFPTDLSSRKQILIRSYLWSSQNYVYYFGHTVASGLTADQVKDCKDNKHYYSMDGTTVERQETPIWKDNQLKNGYVINKEKDGTYSVLYSTMIAEKDNHVNPYVDTIVYHREGNDSDGYEFVEEDAKAKATPIQPYPVLEKEFVVDEAAGTYQFTWDKDKTGAKYTNAEYSVQLSGITTDGKEVLLETVDSVKKNTYTFVDKENNWNYTKLKLEVTRIGEVDKNGKTTKFAATTTDEYTVKLRLSTLAKPTIELLENEIGKVEKNGLRYKISWSGLQSTKELEDLGGYLITVKSTEESKDKQTPEHNYFVLENGRTVVLDGGRKDWIDVTSSYKNTSGDCSATIDLSDFAQNENIAVSVKAIAKDDATIYRDGLEGVERTMMMPSRLNVPDISQMTSQPEYSMDKDGYLTVKEFTKNGITMSLQDGNNDGNDGKFQIAMAVYDKPDGTVTIGADGKVSSDTNKAKVQHVGEPGAGASKVGYWDEGSVATIIGKDENETMAGDLDEASYQLKNLSTDYAGKWLKIVVRAISDNNISSWWSDEDGAGKTYNYAWIHIPRVQIANPAFDIASKDKSKGYLYYLDGQWYNKETYDKDSVEVVPMKQKAFTVSVPDDTEGFNIYVTGASRKDADSSQISVPVYWIHLKKHYADNATVSDGTYDVYYASTESGSDSSAWKKLGNSGTQEDLDTNTEMMQIPYKGEFYETVTDTHSIQSYAWLDFSGLDGKGAGQFQIVLPDMEEIDNKEVTDKNFTAQISVQATAEDKDANYTDSQIANWSRMKNKNGDYVVKTTTLKQYADAPKVQDADIVMQENLDTDNKPLPSWNVMVKAKNRLVAQVQTVKQTNGKNDVQENQYFALPGEGTDGSSVISNFQISMKDAIWKQYQTDDSYVLRMRFAMPGQASDSVSEWTNWKQYDKTQGKWMEVTDQ